MDWTPIVTALVGAGTGGLIGFGAGWWIGRRNTIRGFEHQHGDAVRLAAFDFETAIGKIEEYVRLRPQEPRPSRPLFNDALDRWQALRRTYFAAQSYHPSLPDGVLEEARLRLDGLKKEMQLGRWQEFLAWTAGQVQAIRRTTQDSR